MESIATPAAALPETLGRYELLGVLGRGGMANVYLGRHAGGAGFQRLFAIKVLHPHLAQEDRATESGRAEAAGRFRRDLPARARAQRRGAARFRARVHEAALREFRVAASGGRYVVWTAEITQVEMIIGRENPKLDPTRIPELIRKDDEKLAIAASLGVRWLGYPLLDDEYSRLDVSFRLAGDDWPIAAAFEQRLERVPGVSMGDTRQVASLVHGFDDADVSYRPTIQWLVSEDEALRVALQNEVAAGRLPELINVQVRSVTEFVAAA